MLHENSIFGWIALATCIVLLVPLAAMQFTAQVDWGVADFLIMGALLFTVASGFVLAARRLPRNYRLPIGALLACLFAYVWAELAVGVFTELGS